MVVFSVELRGEMFTISFLCGGEFECGNEDDEELVGCVVLGFL